MPRFPPAVNGGSTEWDSCGWLEGHCPCWMHQIIVNHALLWQAASWVIPLLPELARGSDNLWRVVGEQVPANPFGFRSGSDRGQGAVAPAALL